MSNDEASVLAKTVMFDDEESLTASAITSTTTGTNLYLPTHDRSAIAAVEKNNRKKRLNAGGYYTHLAPTPPQDEFTTTSATDVTATTRGDDPSTSDGTKTYTVISDKSVIKASEQMFAISNPKQLASSNMVLDPLQDQHSMPPLDATQIMGRKNKRCITPPRKWVIALSFFLSLAGFAGSIILLIVLVLGKKHDTTDTITANEENLSSAIRFISSYYLENNTDGISIFANSSTAQHKAVQWVVDSTFVSNFSLPTASSRAVQILQYYALAVVYFATGGTEWIHGYNFLLYDNVCDWNGKNNNSSNIKGVISCTSEGLITGLSLGNNSVLCPNMSLCHFLIDSLLTSLLLTETCALGFLRCLLSNSSFSLFEREQ
jgi:hypothetical protein